MSRLTISLPDALKTKMEKRAKAAGFDSEAAYLLALVRMDCDRGELESVLESRIDGPFAPLETDWQKRVKNAAKSRG